MAGDVAHLQGEMAGEVTQSSAILQSRLTATELADDGDVPGVEGWGAFEISRRVDFADGLMTEWQQATADGDYLIKTKVADLEPGTTYYYRLVYGPTQQETARGPVRSFRTLPAADVTAPVRFVVVTGMNFNKFYSQSGPMDDTPPTEQDYELGYPALLSIAARAPDFFVGTGDNVYYDHPREPAANTTPTMRKKWHEQFVQPRYVDLFANVPTYWEKDDHDCRYDDCDNTGDRLPSPQLGIATFREQVPVVDPLDDDAVTYRTHRIGRLAQIWLLEGRDYRSPNDSPDGPDKTLWGAEQLAWLKRTLSESDAVFKFIISPTPLVGPDDRRKTDNHTDIGGFQHEGQAFYDWLSENGFLDRGLYFICGDRHWQYHSIHASGFEEFSTGALVDANSRLGVKPGDEDGTDPDALIRQPYTSDPPSGGFLLVDVAEGSDGPRAAFEFFDENGKLLHRVVREAPMDTTR
ncbi:MAG: alkaline phosphatase D family protein [Planctomycetales bacterium]|nr:alkaline phosphatase D family protein [Planctomycetales bacterium]